MDVTKLIQQRSREEILREIRSSLLPRWKVFLGLSIWSVLPFFFLFPLWRTGTWGVIVFFVWVASAIGLWMRENYLREYTVCIVTDQRLIDVVQSGVFARELTQGRYDQMEEVRYDIKGVIPTVFRYGTVWIHMRGSASDISIPWVRKPDQLVSLINELRIEHARS